LCGFNDGFDTIDVGIAYDLKDCRSIGSFLQFDHCDVLCFGGRDNSLHRKNVDLTVDPVDHPNVVDVTVGVEVEVVDF
jgi:hypothetical protein